MEKHLNAHKFVIPFLLAGKLSTKFAQLFFYSALANLHTTTYQK